MMKGLSRISKKGVILISAVIMIMAGALVVVLPHSSEGCGGGGCRGGHGGQDSYTSYVNVPILNNTGKTITITKMYVKVPDVLVCVEWKGCGDCKTWSDEARVKDIYFGGTGGPTGTNVFSTDSTHCCCKKCGGYTYESEFDPYDFTGAKVLCTFSLDVNPAPSGSETDKEYTIRYYFRYAGDTEDRTNEVTFNLP